MTNMAGDKGDALPDPPQPPTVTAATATSLKKGAANTVAAASSGPLPAASAQPGHLRVYRSLLGEEAPGPNPTGGLRIALLSQICISTR